MITNYKIFEKEGYSTKKEELIKYFLDNILNKFIDKHYSLPWDIKDGILVNIINIDNISIFLLMEIFKSINNIIIKFDIEMIKHGNNFFIYFGDCDWEKLENERNLDKFNI